MISFYKLIIIYILAINVFAYAIMWFDKYQSKKKGNRISENKLFLLAFLFGSVGIYLGMKYPIYHKATKSSFKFGIPILIILNGVCVYFLNKL